MVKLEWKVNGRTVPPNRVADERPLEARQAQAGISERAEIFVSSGGFITCQPASGWRNASGDSRRRCASSPARNVSRSASENARARWIVPIGVSLRRTRSPSTCLRSELNEICTTSA